MSQETEQTQETTNQEINQPSEQEHKAREQGWAPKEEFSGDPDQWVDAGEFLRRGPLFKKIEEHGKRNKELTFAFNELVKHHKKVKETEYNNALKALREEKKTALAEGDADAVIRAEEAIEELKISKNDVVLKEVPAEPEYQPEFIAWKNRNGWYESESHMKDFADKQGHRLAKQGMDKAEILVEVEKLVRKEFPTRFKNPNQERANSVEGNSNSKQTESKSKYKPTDDERRIAQAFVRQGAFKSAEDYYAELQKTKG